MVRGSCIYTWLQTVVGLTIRQRLSTRVSINRACYLARLRYHGGNKAVAYLFQ